MLEVAERFAIVPEWLLDADISDTAIRLYAVLLRYGQSSGARMPGRATLARRLRKRSVDTIDRAMRELVDVGAVTVEHRFAGGRRLTNRYHLNATQPSSAKAHRPTQVAEAKRSCPPEPTEGGSRAAAATQHQNGQVEDRIEDGGSRTNAARVAAPLRHNPKQLTQIITTSPPPPAAPAAPKAESEDAVNRWRVEEDRFLQRLGIRNPAGFVADIAALRRDAGGPSARWARPSLVAALQAAVKARGWPAHHAAAALRIVAADPTTRSPMRLAEAGPWWDEAAVTVDGTAAAEPARTTPDHASDLPLDRIEADLAEAVSRPGSDGDSFYWIPTPAGSVC